MQRVRAIRSYVPGIGKRGALREIDDRSARVLILLGKVEAAPKRAYKRRDMVAESAEPPAEFEAE